MGEFITAIFEFAQEHWSRLVPVVIAAVGSFWAGFAAMRRWRRREFLHRLNVSLTQIDAGTLKIRTLLEMDCEAIFLNKAAAKQIVKYARAATAGDPILPIPSEERWNYLNAVLNEVSERFAEGQIKRDMGVSVRSENYLMCLTCEKAGPVKTQKIRALVVRKSLLLKLPKEPPKYESPSHVTRWETLQFMANAHVKTPEHFIEIEICL